MFSSVVSMTRSAALRTGSSSDSFQLDCFDQAFRFGVEWVFATRSVVSLHQLSGRCIEKHDAYPMTVASECGNLWQHVDVLAARHQGQPFDVATRFAGQFDNGVDQ